MIRPSPDLCISANHQTTYVTKSEPNFVPSRNRLSNDGYVRINMFLQSILLSSCLLNVAANHGRDLTFAIPTMDNEVSTRADF